VIRAYTDNVGSATSNLQLSRRRAIAVARYLIEAGISGSRLKPQAFGESNPRATNLTSLGRAANRRVEFSILQ
jgi:outer membrane protein OmpA-like peptidoglycan-associated protein